MTEANNARPGLMFIVSAPSGAGKSTLCQAARARFPDLRYSISATSRKPRSGEINGKDYFFVSKDEFKQGIKQGRWAEWAVVHDNYYGTPGDVIQKTLADGSDILLDIDVQGARQLMDRFPDSISIFIMPPSLEILRQRLENRGTDAPESILLRLENAKQEMAAKDRYRHIVVNNDLDRAIAEFISLIAGFRQSP